MNAKDIILLILTSTVALVLIIGILKPYITGMDSSIETQTLISDVILFTLGIIAGALSTYKKRGR